jgi:DNA-binding NtrC family response regulator
MPRPLTEGRYKREMIEYERRVLKSGLIEAGGDLARASKIMDLPRKTYYLRLEYCGLDLNLIRAEIEANEVNKVPSGG